MESSEKELPLSKETMTKYGWIFILSKYTLADISHSRRTIVPFTLARRISTIVENQQQKSRYLSELKENLKNMTTPSI